MHLFRINLGLCCMLFSSLAAGEPKLPADLLAYMETLDISYTPVQKKQLSEIVYWYNEDAVDKVIGDFDGDNRTDYALIVTSRETYTSVVVFLRRESSFSHKVLFDLNVGNKFDKNKIIAVMFPVHGEFDTLDETVEVKNIGLHIGAIEIATTSLHFWEDGGFKKRWTSD